jgi:hypothetical protein
MAKTASRERGLAREKQSAAKRAIAAQLRANGATFDQIGAALKLSREGVRRLILKSEHLASRPKWLSALPSRAVLFLRLRGFDDLPEAAAAAAVAKAFNRRDLKAQPNFGRQAFEAIVAWLAAHGLTLRDGGPS